MKKLFFVALAAVAMTFTACKNDKPATDQPKPQENTEVAEVNYTDSLKAALENSDASKIEQFVNEVKEKITGVDAAKFAPQLEAVQTWLKDNADKIKEVLGDKFGGVEAAITAVANFDAKSLLDSAAEGAENAAEGAVEGAKDVVEGAVEEGKSAVETVKEGAEQVAGDVKATADKAVEEVKNAPENLKEAGKKAATDAINNL